jgi:hypothetical protein
MSLKTFINNQRKKTEQFQKDIGFPALHINDRKEVKAEKNGQRERTDTMSVNTVVWYFPQACKPTLMSNSCNEHIRSLTCAQKD